MQSLRLYKTFSSAASFESEALAMDPTSRHPESKVLRTLFDQSVNLLVIVKKQRRRLPSQHKVSRCVLGTLLPEKLFTYDYIFIEMSVSQ